MRKAIIVIAILIAASFFISACTSTKQGYIQKEYPFGSVGMPAKQEVAQPAEPSETANATPEAVVPQAPAPKPPVAVPAANATKPSANVTQPSTPVKTGTGTITPESKTISLEHLDYANVNVIVVTGTKDVELSVGSVKYLFQDPRVDTDQTLCIISINGVDRYASLDETLPLDGIKLELRDAINARSIENTQCEFLISNT